MNLKSSTKKSGFSLRTTGARNLACQYKQRLNTLSSYSEVGQLNRWQASTWNFSLATGGRYQWRQAIRPFNVKTVRVRCRNMSAAKTAFAVHMLQHDFHIQPVKVVLTPSHFRDVPKESSLNAPSSLTSARKLATLSRARPYGRRSGHLRTCPSQILGGRLGGGKYRLCDGVHRGQRKIQS